MRIGVAGIVGQHAQATLLGFRQSAAVQVLLRFAMPTRNIDVRVAGQGSWAPVCFELRERTTGPTGSN